jgi:hypothetical protein
LDEEYDVLDEDESRISGRKVIMHQEPSKITKKRNDAVKYA